MYFAVTATKFNGKRFENLDNKQELEEFSQKVIKLNFNKLTVKAYNEQGFVKQIDYILNPQNDTLDKKKVILKNK